MKEIVQITVMLRQRTGEKALPALLSAAIRDAKEDRVNPAGTEIFGTGYYRVDHWQSDDSLPGTREEKQIRWSEQALDGHHGGFGEALARAFNRADDKNAERLAAAFPELFDCLVAIHKRGEP